MTVGLGRPDSPSMLPLASVWPSGLECHRSTAWVPPISWSDRSVRRIGDIPRRRPCRVVVAAGQQAAIGTERHRVDGPGTAGQGPAERLGAGRIGDIPRPDRRIVAGGRHAAVGLNATKIAAPVPTTGAVGRRGVNGSVRHDGHVAGADQAWLSD